jgi:hypothetical protein
MIILAFSVSVFFFWYQLVSGDCWSSFWRLMCAKFVWCPLVVCFLSEFCGLLDKLCNFVASRSNEIRAWPLVEMMTFSLILIFPKVNYNINTKTGKSQCCLLLTYHSGVPRQKKKTNRYESNINKSQ